MLKKITLLVNIALFPFQNLRFYGQKEIFQALGGSKEDGVLNNEDRRNAQKALLINVQNEMLRKANPKSLDEINLLLYKFYPMLCNDIEAENAGYFDVNNDIPIERMLYQHYFKILEEFGEALISYRDGEIVFKYWKNDVNGDKKWIFIDFMNEYKGQEKVHFFHTISRFIPMDLIVTLHCVKNRLFDPIQLHEFYQHINLADAGLDEILRRGVAENHVHASAAFNFAILWQMVMNADSNDKKMNKYLRYFQPNHLATSTQQGKVECYILTARLLRWVLTLYLHSEVYSNYLSDDCFSDLVRTPVHRTLSQWIKDTFADEKEIEILLLQEITGTPQTNFVEPIRLKQAIEKIKIQLVDINDVKSQDFITDIFINHRGVKTYGENIFLHFCSSYKYLIKQTEMKPNSSKHITHFEEFYRAFFRYIAIKNEFYQQVTQPTIMQGLDFFRGYFSRATKGVIRNPDYYKTMLRTLFQNRYLKKVELRILIEDKLKDNKKSLYEILHSYKEVLKTDFNVEEDSGIDFPLLGIVYHLMKKSDNVKKDLLLYEDGNNDSLKSALHFGQIQEKYITQVQHLQELRKVVPMATNFIIGLDAASLENNTPVQVFAPVFEEARDSRYDALRIKDPNGHILPRQSLFFTFHAGEDFRHIVSGLRRMDEVVRYCKLHAGDRIGHGIALGIDKEEWIKANPLVVMPRGEYLDNLLWTWGVYSNTPKLQTETLVYLERTIDRVATEIFGDAFEASDLKISILYNVYEQRFKRRSLEAKRIKEILIKQEKLKIQDRIYQTYHYELTLRKMEEPIYITMNEIETMMIEDMQQYLIGKFSSSGIIIEVNPSSNEAIGGINSIFGNQLFNLQTAKDSDIGNVLVNVNSDDPMVFNTNVSNELVYMYYGMLQRGIGREAALNWIEKLRRAGMETSFIREGISRKRYLYFLDMTIKALEDPAYAIGN